MIYGIFSELAFGKFTIYINNRKLLRGLLEALGIPLEQHDDGAPRGRSPRARSAATKVEDRVAAIVGRGPREAAARRADSALARARPLALERPRQRRRCARASPSSDAVYDGTLALGVPGVGAQGRPLDRARPRLLHRHRLRDVPRRPPAARLDLLGRPLRQPRRALHEVEAPRRRHLDRRDAPVLAARRARRARPAARAIARRRRARRRRAGRGRARDRAARRRLQRRASTSRATSSASSCSYADKRAACRSRCLAARAALAS